MFVGHNQYHSSLLPLYHDWVIYMEKFGLDVPFSFITNADKVLTALLAVKAQKFRFISFPKFELILRHIEPQSYSYIHELVLVLSQPELTSSSRSKSLKRFGLFINAAISSSGPI